MSVTAAPIHPNPQDVTSVTAPPPLPPVVRCGRTGPEVRAGLAEQNLPGISVAVGIGQDIVWAEGFGWADLEKRLLVAPRTRFRIGHVSKTFTSAAVGRAAGKQCPLNLDDEIQTYVPAFPLQTVAGHSAPVHGTHGGDQALPR